MRLEGLLRLGLGGPGLLGRRLLGLLDRVVGGGEVRLVLLRGLGLAPSLLGRGRCRPGGRLGPGHGGGGGAEGAGRRRSGALDVSEAPGARAAEQQVVTPVATSRVIEQPGALYWIV